MSKKIICLLLFVMLVSSAETLQAKIYSGIAGDDSMYTVDTEEKIITIEGEGVLDGLPTEEEEFRDIPDMHVVIGEGITQIDSFRFPRAHLTSIHLPASLKIIKDGAFAGCRRLESIVIPGNVDKIGKTAFEDCRRLKVVTNYSNAEVCLPNHPDCYYYYMSPYDYYVEGERSVTVPPGKTAIGKVKKCRAILNSENGTLSKYDTRRYVYYRFGEILKLPSVKWKGHVFCGWTTEEHSNYAWYDIKNKDTENPHSTTLCWWGEKNLYAQFAKINAKKLGKRKLKLSISKWRDAGRLEIQYSTSKNFKKSQSIIVKQGQLTYLWPYAKTNKTRHYKLYYQYNKQMLSVTFSKLKAAKKYYFRFRYSGNDRLNADDYVYSVGDWFKTSVKM